MVQSFEKEAAKQSNGLEWYVKNLMEENININWRSPQSFFFLNTD